MKNLFYYSFLVLCVFAIDSCHQSDQASTTINPSSAREKSDRNRLKQFQDESVSGDFELKNGMLCFRNFDTFLNVDSTVGKYSTERQIKFAKDLGLSSLLLKRSQLANELKEVTSQTEYTQVLSKNSNYFSLINNELVCNFDESSSFLVNDEGMVSIGGIIHLFAKDGMIVGNSAKDVRQFYTTGVSPNENTKIFKNSKTKSGAKLASCTTCTCFGINRQGYNGDNKRRIDLLVGHYTETFYVSPGYVGVLFYTAANGYAFKRGGVFGNGDWTTYETDNHLIGFWNYTLNVYANGVSTYKEGAVTQSVDNYGSSINVRQLMHVEQSVSETDMAPGNTGAFNWNAQMGAYRNPQGVTVGKYYSTGVPDPRYIQCEPQ